MEKNRAAERAEKRRLWEVRLKNWKASGLSQAQYCREHGLGVHRFIYWKKRIMPEKISLVELPIPGLLRSLPALCLVVGEHYRIEIQEGFDAASLQQVIRIVNGL